MDGTAFLEDVASRALQPIYAVHGDEDFLKRQVLAALRRKILESEEDSLGMSVFDGEQASYAQVIDELFTLPFLSPRRLVILDRADPFVSEHRASLEKLVAAPPASGVLVLELKSFPSNTRLAKLLKDEGNLTCKAPPPYKVPEWCVRWCTAQQGKTIAREAASLLVDLVGTDMGILDQELAKLAAYVGNAKRISSEDVDKLVGRSREENLWKIFDAIGTGQSAQAMTILTRLLDQGEEPLRILGAFGVQLRRLVQASRLHKLGQPLSRACQEAGIPPFAQKSTEQLLRYLGPKRVDKLMDWLLEVDRGIKSTAYMPPRVLLERLLVQLARADGQKS